MFHIGSIIPKILQRKEIKKQVEVVGICKIANKIMNERFGEENTKIGFFRNCTLQIKCLNPAIANEIQICRERIKNEINEELNKQEIKNIVVRVM